MKNEKFKNLILDAYKNNLIGIVYSTTQTFGFSNLKNVEEFVETINADMIYLKSRFTGTEIDVYEWELEDYKIKHSENTIYVKVKNKPEVALMY